MSFIDLTKEKDAMPTQTIDDFLPCPFCGGRPKIVWKPSHTFDDCIACRRCGAVAYENRWNDRVSAPEITRLKRVIEVACQQGTFDEMTSVLHAERENW